MCKFKTLEKFKDYYVAIYTIDDRLVTTLENIDETSNFFNMPMYVILQRIRNNELIKFGKTFVKLYLMPKTNIHENYRRVI